MTEKKFFIHIGWHKTATTSLQNVLSNMDSIQYLGKPHSEEMFQLMTYLIYPNDIFFDKAQFQKRLKQQIYDNKPQTIVISDELLSPCNVSNPIRFARLKDNFPDLKIILTIRNQVSILKSFYVHQFVKKSYFSESHYHDWIERGINGNWTDHFYTQYNAASRGQYINAVAYNYIHSVTHLEQLFGRENIEILLFEDFTDDFSTFLSRLCQFIGTELPQESEVLKPHLNPGKSKKVKTVKRRILKRLRRSQFLHDTKITNVAIQQFATHVVNSERKQGAAKIKSVNLTIPDHLKKQVLAYYEPGNRTLEKNYSLRMKSRGYFDESATAVAPIS